MAIAKGENWGEAGNLVEGSPIASTNQELRAAITIALRAGDPVPEVGLLGGDLALTLGVHRAAGDVGRERDRLQYGDAQRLTVDIGLARLDEGEPHWFLSHLVARRSWLWGRLVVVANAAWMGEWNIVPRSHPGDGRFDMMDTEMGLLERLRGRGRLAHGGHVPHPEIATKRSAEFDLDLDRALNVWLDSERVGRARHLHIERAGETLTVVI